MHIFISNLNNMTTASHLFTLLVPFGHVLSAKIQMNGETGRSLGSAYVEMERVAGKVAVYELDNKRFMNSYIHVEETSSIKA
jgi:RNA recognition motif-containing protein